MRGEPRRADGAHLVGGALTSLLRPDSRVDRDATEESGDALERSVEKRLRAAGACSYVLRGAQRDGADRAHAIGRRHHRLGQRRLHTAECVSRSQRTQSAREQSCTRSEVGGGGGGRTRPMLWRKKEASPPPQVCSTVQRTQFKEASLAKRKKKMYGITSEAMPCTPEPSKLKRSQHSKGHGPCLCVAVRGRMPPHPRRAPTDCDEQRVGEGGGGHRTG